MDSRTLKFFEDRNLQVAKVIELGKKRFALESHHIKQAMDIVYQEIMDGKMRDNRNIAYAVCRVAKELDSNKYQDDQRIISDTRAVLDEINKELSGIREEKDHEKRKNESLEDEMQALIDNYESLIAEMNEEHRIKLESKNLLKRLINFGMRRA